MQRDGQQIQEGFPALNLPGMGNFVIVDLCFRDVPGSGRERLPCCPFSFALIQLCPFNEEISIFWAGFGGDGVVIFKLQHAKKKNQWAGSSSIYWILKSPQLAWHANNSQERSFTCKNPESSSRQQDQERASFWNSENPDKKVEVKTNALLLKSNILA